MNDITISQPYHGLLEDEGHIRSNWGLSHTTKPAVYVEPISYADVQAVVRDEQRFPTPINPVGSLLSVTSTIVNDGGTMLCTRKLDEILGLESDSTGRKVVRVQAGCRLKKLNMWLQARRMEIVSGGNRRGHGRLRRGWRYQGFVVGWPWLFFHACRRSDLC